ENRIPIDQALAAIDQSLFAHAHEDFYDGARHLLVHREVARALPFGVRIAPVCGRPESPHLAGDGGARLLPPLPDTLDERLAPEVVPRSAFGLKLALDDDLGRDTGVVGTHDPIGVVAAHAVIPDEGVHQGLLERMPHVQRAGNVRRGQLYAIGGLALVGVRPEISAAFPEGIPARLDGRGLETLGELHIGSGRSGKSGHYIRAQLPARRLRGLGFQPDAQRLQLGVQRLFDRGAHHGADVRFQAFADFLEHLIERAPDVRHEAVLQDFRNALVKLAAQLLVDAVLEVLHLHARDHFTAGAGGWNLKPVPRRH